MMWQNVAKRIGRKHKSAKAAVCDGTRFNFPLMKMLALKFNAHSAGEEGAKWRK